MPWTVYCHIHRATGRRYVGLTKRTWQRRWSQHVIQSHSSRGGRWHFPNAIREYGPEAFDHEVLEVCDSLEEGNVAEVRWIEYFDSVNPEKGFNLVKGGSHTPHLIKNPWDRPGYRERVSSSIKARWQDPRTRARNVAGLRAKMATFEYRANLSNALRGRTLDSEHRARISENMMLKHASETIEEKKAASERMNEALRRKKLCRTNDEIQADFNRKSHTSKSLNSIAAVQTPEAIARHRAKCSKLNDEDIALILSLRKEGYTRTEVSKMFNVARKTVAYHEGRRS